MWNQNYFVYILTNETKSVIYKGITNNLQRRLYEHSENTGTLKSFTGRYNCNNLIFFERHLTAEAAIKREKQIKGWLRKKKIDLINSVNPTWKFLNNEVNVDSSLCSE